MLYAQHFTRMNFKMTPPLQEEVCVIFETDIPYEDEHIEAFENLKWNELYKQYPLWVCPYHQGKPPPNALEEWRHSFCSPSAEGPPIIIGGDNKHYQRFRNPEKPIPADSSRYIKVEMDVQRNKQQSAGIIQAIEMVRGVKTATLAEG